MKDLPSWAHVVHRTLNFFISCCCFAEDGNRVARFCFHHVKPIVLVVFPLSFLKLPTGAQHWITPDYPRSQKWGLPIWMGTQGNFGLMQTSDIADWHVHHLHYIIKYKQTKRKPLSHFHNYNLEITPYHVLNLLNREMKKTKRKDPWQDDDGIAIRPDGTLIFMLLIATKLISRLTASAVSLEAFCATDFLLPLQETSFRRILS